MLKSHDRNSGVNQDHLILFTRYPQPGNAKTRLIPALGAKAAAALQRKMTEHTVAWIRNLVRTRKVSVEIRFAGGAQKTMRQWLGGDFGYTPQTDGDLGERMHRGLVAAHHAGARRTVLIGSDIPGLTDAVLHRAFDLLHERPLVFGPALDGGYYLVGMNRTVDAQKAHGLFRGITWSRADVLARTLHKATTAGLQWHLVDRLGDIDDPANLHRWRERPHPPVATDAIPRISVVIPTLNEAHNLPRTIAGLRTSEPCEIIVVDGGSRDRTLARAAAMGVKTLHARSSRGVQLNLGAAHARGEILLFLHADTCLPRDWPIQVQTAAKKAGFAAGAFRLRIDGQGRALRLVEKMANWRSRWLRLPYGDQGLFTTRALFRRLGGFRPLPIMEDFEFVRRVRRHGRMVLLASAASTSARRWARLGVLKTTLKNQVMLMGYHSGISPARLARFYRGTGGR